MGFRFFCHLPSITPFFGCIFSSASKKVSETQSIIELMMVDFVSVGTYIAFKDFVWVYITLLSTIVPVS